VLVSPVAGIVLYLIILLALITWGSLTSTPAYGRLYLAMSLVPLMQIVTLSIAFSDLSESLAYAVVLLLLLIAVHIIVTTLDLKLRDIGLTFQHWPIQILVVLSGVALGDIGALFLEPEISFNSLNLVIVFAFLIFAGFIEELIFRGILQRFAIDVFGKKGVFLATILFTALYIGWLSILGCLFVLSIGLLFGWVVKETGSIIGVGFSHGIINIIIYLAVT